MQRNRRPRIVDYAIAALAVALATLARLAMGGILGPRQPFATYMLAAFFAALYLGRGPAVLATALGAATGVALFIAPYKAMTIAEPVDVVVLLTFLVIAGAAIALGSSYRTALLRLAAEADARRGLEQAERADRERLEATLVSLGEGVIVAGPDGRVAMLNPVAEELTGWPVAEAVGRPLAEVFRTRDRRTTRTHELPVAEILGGRLVHRTPGPALLARRDGSTRPVEATSAAIRDGGEGGLVVALRDVSERLRVEEAERADRERVRLALEAGRLGAWDWDLRTGRIAWAGHGPSLCGLPEDALDGPIESFRDLVHPDDLGAITGAASRAIRGNRPFEAEFRLRRPDGSTFWMSGRGAVLRDEEGRAVRLVGICADVTERRRAEQTARFLADAGAALASLVDEEEALRKVADLAVPFFADWAAVDLVGPDGRPRLVAVAHADPAKVGLAAELHRRYPPDPDAPLGVSLVLRTGRPDMMAEIDPGAIDQAARDDEHRQVLRDLGLRSYVCVPLRSREEVIGAISFVHAESGRRFGPADLAMAEDLAHRATIALENARLYEELRDSERRFRQLAEHITDVFYVSDPGAGEFLYISPAYEAIWGRPAGALICDPASLLQSVHPDDRGRVASAIGRHRLGEATAEEYRILRPDGEIRWIYDRGFPIRDGLGRASRVAGIAEDVTARKLAEAAMRESEGRFRLLAEAVPQIVWVRWADGELAYINRRWTEYTGLSEDETRDAEARLSAIHPDDRETVVVRWEEATRASAAFEAEYRLRGRDGAHRWFLGRAVPARDEGGRIASWFGTATDIDDRKRAERTLRLLADAGALLADPTDLEGTIARIPALLVPTLADSCVVYLVGPDGEIRRAAVAHRDPALHRLMAEVLAGLAIDPAGPSPVAEVIRSGRPDLRPEIAPEILAALIPDPGCRDRLRGALPASHLIVPMVAGGRTVGAFGLAMTGPGRRLGPDDLPVAEDLARRAAIALENARLYRELHEADRRKTEFLAVLAHELRNPLAPIRTALELLRAGVDGRDGDGDGDGRGSTLDREAVRSMAGRQVVHMARLIDDLMDVTRISRGTIELRPEPVELAPLVRRVVSAAEALVAEAGLALEVDLPGPPAWLDADPARLEQILWNLVNNAAKYTDPGGRVALSASAGGGEATIRVRDSGIGIAPEMLGRVFELFVQAEGGTSRKRGGLGIGLSLVRTLVELHGGTISARSDGPGRGSEFVVRLPTRPAPPASEPEGAGERTTAALAAPAPPRRRILVVDDNRDAAVSLGALLGKLGGHDVRLAHDGPEALRVAREFAPEVVLLDIGLPGMDGLEVARRLRRDPTSAGAMLIALTGWGQEEDRRRSREAGFDHHLVKPVDVDRIEALIASAAVPGPG